MDRDYLIKAYIYIIASLTIGVAIYNIMTFFGGVGLALVGFSVMLILAVRSILKSGEFKKRFGDIYVLIVLEAILMLILFFAVDYRTTGEITKFAFVFKNIISIYSIVALMYILFRFFGELNGKKYKAVEYMLGNYTPQPREKKVKVKKSKSGKTGGKKNKELENGTLAPKPSSMATTTEVDTDEQQDEALDEQAEGESSQSTTDNDTIMAEEMESESQNNDNYSNNWY